MNQILLNPTDVLFFRDGRPIEGSLTGHGAAWPLPTVLNQALHLALHRATQNGQIENHTPHQHRIVKEGKKIDTEREKKFGSLLSTGPFPVLIENHQETWFFPRPLDCLSDLTAEKEPELTATLHPKPIAENTSNLPAPLTHAVTNSNKPSKTSPSPWWSQHTFQAYLDDTKTTPITKKDSEIFSAQHSYGIAISPQTDTVEEGKFYSASYLRLHQNWRLGALATAIDKNDANQHQPDDLIPKLFPSEQHILIGGQQRICTVEHTHLSQNNQTLPLPHGTQLENFEKQGPFLLKFILLTPAIFPQIDHHPGGWLPSWISPDGSVQLKAGNTAREQRESREKWRNRIKALPPIPAKLIAAITGKPLPVTGYGLTEGEHTGPRPTLLAVPAGSIYYFECQTRDALEQLANALNWHGSDTSYQHIHNRRSTLLGEKGFGIGVCAPFKIN